MSAEKKIQESYGRVCRFNWKNIDITCLFHTYLWRMLTNFYSGVSSLMRVLFECYISQILTLCLQLWTHPLGILSVFGRHWVITVCNILYMNARSCIVSSPFLNLNELIHWCWLSFHYPVQCHRLIGWMSLLLLFSVNCRYLRAQKSNIISMLTWDTLNFQGLGLLLASRHQCKKCGQSLFGSSS